MSGLIDFGGGVWSDTMYVTVRHPFEKTAGYSSASVPRRWLWTRLLWHLREGSEGLGLRMLVHVNDLNLKIAQVKYPRWRCFRFHRRWSTSQNLLSLQHWFLDRNMRAEASLLLIIVERLALETTGTKVWFRSIHDLGDVWICGALVWKLLLLEGKICSSCKPPVTVFLVCVFDVCWFGL